MGLGSGAQKPAISLKRCNIGSRLVWQPNRKSHAHFRLLPKSVTLDDLERPKRYSCRNRKCLFIWWMDWLERTSWPSTCLNLPLSADCMDTVQTHRLIRLLTSLYRLSGWLHRKVVHFVGPHPYREIRRHWIIEPQHAVRSPARFRVGSSPVYLVYCRSWRYRG